ncbi:MAG TPA: tetratricopeptide repeat protein, partial [Gemmatimonadales bacterium]|nr:tetratricopeptide repeat protein [Gemmatimonadales bacterium]
MVAQGTRADSGYRRALSLFDSLPEPAPGQRGTAEFMLANHLLATGKYVEADSAGQRALRIFTRWNGPDNVWVAHAHSTLSFAALAQGQRTRALAEVETALHILEGKSISVLERTRIQVQQARVLIALGRQAEAVPIAEQLLAQRRASIPDAPLMIAEATLLLGELRLQQRRLPDAEVLFREAYADFEQALGKTSPFAKEAAGDLVFLYSAWGKPEQAAAFAALLPPALVTARVAAARRWARRRQP